MGIAAHQSDGQTIEQRDEYIYKHSFPDSHDNSDDCNGREKELSNNGVKKQDEEAKSPLYSDTTACTISFEGNTNNEAQPPSEQPDLAQTDATATATAEPMPSNAV